MSEVIDFPEVSADEGQTEEYYTLRVRRILSGQTVWMQRDFDSGTGRVLDLFSDREHKGFIELDFSNMSCSAYKTPIGDPNGEPVRVTPEPTTVSEAVRILQEEALLAAS